MKPRKQEQERATDQITEIAPNVLRSELPIELPGLGHVNMYLLEDERGVAVVDPGLPEKASYAAVEARLKAAGYPIERVHTIVITHSHHDHYGGAAWLQERSGGDAKIVTHRDFQMMWEPVDVPDVDVEDFAELAGEATLDGQDQELQSKRRVPWAPPVWGGPGMDLPLKRKLMFYTARYLPMMRRRLPRPTNRLVEAETIRLARRDWIAVHTPGHTNDHLCLFDPTEGCMICGDHVLPTITPHIGGMGGRELDPLAAFFPSLDKMVSFGDQVTVALPAHGRPFNDLAGRSREIKEHHLGRLELLRTTSATLGRPASVMEMSTYLFSPRAQGVMADSETYAHLEYLRLRGEMVRNSTDGVYEYVLPG
ncbi:MAG TPA: MBL fold metallo-hydrolase [Ilumatobacteraceae bacterium]|nr:MBL fold metallo-hydrolase [Ilumatobacteraceae bacterium]